MFRPIDFTEKFLNFNSNFEIAEGNSVIFAPNGTGKTSIYRTLINKEENKLNIFPLDYDSIKDNFVKSKKVISFGPNIKQIEEIDSEISNEIDKTKLSQIFKLSGVSTIGVANRIMPGFGDIFKDDNKFLKLYTDKNIVKLLPYAKYSVELLNHFDEIKESATLLEDIENLENIKLRELLDQVLVVIDDNTTTCPICETTKNEPISKLVKQKRGKLNTLNGKIIELISKKHTDLSNEIIEKEITEFVNLVKDNNISVEDIISLQVTPHDTEVDATKFIKKINSSKSVINEYEKTKHDGLIRLETFFNKVSKNPYYKNKLCAIFEVDESKIVLDKDKFKITIKLDRDIKTYSTGELNIALFITSLYEFMQTDKQYLVLDDPISSFDIPNQYRIIYEINSMLSSEEYKEKKVILFTHNLDVINIVRNESVLFKYFAIESSFRTIKGGKIDKELVKREILLDNNLNFNTILRRLNDISYHDLNYIHAIKAREEKGEDKPGDTEKVEPNLHNVFHFHGNFIDVEYNGQTLSNKYLYEKISKINNSGDLEKEKYRTEKDNNTFYGNIAEKILLLSGLRVWIEKQIYDLVKTDEVKEKEFLGVFMLHEKLDIAFAENLDDQHPETLFKNQLMSKKTMLNHNSHYNSLMVPYNYAMNLSLSNIEEEIIEIKNMFKEFN